MTHHFAPSNDELLLHAAVHIRDFGLFRRTNVLNPGGQYFGEDTPNSAVRSEPRTWLTEQNPIRNLWESAGMESYHSSKTGAIQLRHARNAT